MAKRAARFIAYSQNYADRSYYLKPLWISYTQLSTDPHAATHPELPANYGTMSHEVGDHRVFGAVCRGKTT